MPRRATCDCGECLKCRKRVYMRNWYRGKSLEERQALVSGRDRERVLAADRARHQARKDDPEYRSKRNARSVLNNAVRDGRVERGECEFGGDDCRGGIEAHHHDYSQPLDVRWLCKAHHDEMHPCLTTA